MSLIEAQKASYDVVNHNLLPFYNSAYIEKSGCHIWIYDKAYKASYCVYWLVATVVDKVANAILCCLTPCMTRNPINGDYLFLPITRFLEKTLAYWILYPIVTWGMRRTFDCHSGKPIHESVEEVFNQVLLKNEDLLNPAVLNNSEI